MKIAFDKDDELLLSKGLQPYYQSEKHCKPPDTPRTGFKLSQNLSLGFGRESCAVVITTTPRFFVSQIEKLLSY